MNYKIFAHLDKPQRFLTLTVDELALVIIGVLLMLIATQKLVISIFVLALFMGLRWLKKGEGPKALIKLSYWYLPYFITQFFLPKLPPSYWRLWRA